MVGGLFVFVWFVSLFRFLFCFSEIVYFEGYFVCAVQSLVEWMYLKKKDRPYLPISLSWDVIIF